MPCATKLVSIPAASVVRKGADAMADGRTVSSQLQLGHSRRNGRPISIISWFSQAGVWSREARRSTYHQADCSRHPPLLGVL